MLNDRQINIIRGALRWTMETLEDNVLFTNDWMDKETQEFIPSEDCVYSDDFQEVLDIVCNPNFKGIIDDTTE